MFEQHPVPQQISSYQFRLVGDMTLKQFFQLAAGVVIGLLIYASPLPGLFKWPLIAIFVIGGAAFAFLPIQDRPLAVWMIAFFRSIYGPTVYGWKVLPKEDYFIKDLSEAQKTSQVQPGTSTAQTGTQPTDTTPTQSAHILDMASQNLEKTEQSFMQRISGLMSMPHTTGTKPQAQQNPASNQPPLPKPPVSPVAASHSAYLVTQEIKENTAKTQQETGGSQATPGVGRGVSVPQLSPVTVTSTNRGEETTPIAPPEARLGADKPNLGNAASPGQVATSEVAQTKKALFDKSKAPPMAPEVPNTLSGQVLDKNGKLISGVILDVKDDLGRSVRALRSNELGHFMVVTPLSNGTYTLSGEKEGYVFNPIKITTEGKIIEPIAFIAN